MHGHPTRRHLRHRSGLRGLLGLPHPRQGLGHLRRHVRRHTLLSARFQLRRGRLTSGRRRTRGTMPGLHRRRLRLGSTFQGAKDDAVELPVECGALEPVHGDGIDDRHLGADLDVCLAHGGPCVTRRGGKPQVHAGGKVDALYNLPLHGPLRWLRCHSWADGLNKAGVRIGRWLSHCRRIRAGRRWRGRFWRFLRWGASLAPDERHHEEECDGNAHDRGLRWMVARRIGAPG